MLTCDGRLLDSVADAIAGLRDAVSVRLPSADTTPSAPRGRSPTCSASSSSPSAMLSAVALGVAVIGSEDAALQAVAAADVVCTSMFDALALLREPARITATLRR